MKYLMPLIHQTNLNNNIENINKVNLKYHVQNIKTNIPSERKYKKIYIKKPNFNFRSMSAESVNSIKNTGLPTIQRKSVETDKNKNNARIQSGYKLISYKIKSGSSRISSTSAGNN